MKVTAGESSTPATIAYDGTRELLQLEFNSRALYQYLDVPATVHEALLRAPSKGSYSNQVIRGKIPYSRISHGQTEAPEQDIAAGVGGNGESHGGYRRRSTGWQPGLPITSVWA